MFGRSASTFCAYVANEKIIGGGSGVSESSRLSSALCLNGVQCVFRASSWFDVAALMCAHKSMSEKYITAYYTLFGFFCLPLQAMHYEKC